MKNRMLVIGTFVFLLGLTMILGTSYSLITNHLVSNETYGFKVANFDVSFNEDTDINVSSIPMTDEEGINSSNEYMFTVDNNSDYAINYRLDIIENSNYNIKNVIRYAYSINDSEYSDVYLLKDNITINQNKVLKTNASDVYKIKMWLSDDADESYMNKSFSVSIVLSATQNEYKYATTVIEKLGNTGKDNVVRSGINYRYKKNSSSNYVWFNCLDGFTNGDNYCERWRIIGSFYNKSELRNDLYPSLKIISTKAYNEIAYNFEENNNYDNAYINSFANGYFYDRLSNDTQKLILKAKWNIGDVVSNRYEDAIKEEETSTYYAYIGLPNISDYLFLDDSSFFINNLIFLNKTNGNVNILNGKIVSGNNQKNYSFVPCVYLRSDVSITKGDGSYNSPYELSIKYPLNY